MGVEYQNRHGDVYRLLMGKTKTGKPKYYMAKSRRSKGAPVDEIPDGFEIHEDPTDARVVLRRIVTHLTTEAEKELLEETIRSETDLKDFQVERAGDALVVYISNFNPNNNGAQRLIREFGLKAVDFLAARATYSRMMRFVLADQKKRLFAVDRWCFRGSIDDWFPIAGPGQLSEHAEKYVRHLGKESFFELM